MSTKSPAYLALVLRGVLGEGAGATRKWFRDDNFLNNWTRSAGDGSFTTDGDIGTLQNGPGLVEETWDNTTTVALTNTFPKLVVRARRRDGVNPRIKVFYTDLSSETFDPSNATSFTVNTFSLAAGKTINKIQITNVGATNGNATEWEFVILCKDTPLDITQYILPGGHTNQGLGSKGNLTLKLNNDNARFWKSPNRINQSDVIYVWAAEATVVQGFRKPHKLFGGLVRGLRGGVSRSGKTLTLTARPWGAVFDKIMISRDLSGLADETAVFNIKEDVNTQGWNFASITAPAAGFTIQDTLAVAIMDWQVERRSASQTLGVLSDWLVARRTGGAELPVGTADRGCEWRVTPSELFEWGVIDNFFALDSTTRTQENEIANADLEELTEHIVNAVYLVGKVVLPFNGDKYSENDAANWVMFGNTTGASIVDEATIKKVGTKGLKCTTGNSISVVTGYERTIPTIKGPLGNNNFPPTIRGWFRNQTGASLNFIELGVGTTGAPANAGEKFTPIPTRDEWADFHIPQNTVTVPGSNRIGFRAESTSANHVFYVDNLRLEGFIIAVAFDNSSINTHGRTEAIVIDRTPRETLEHRRIARGHLRKWNNSFFEGSIKFQGFYGPNAWGVLPGDRLDMTLTDYNQTTKRYRVLSVAHSFPYPLMTTIEVTDNLVTIETPKGSPTLAEILKDEPGFKTLLSREDRELRLSDLIAGMTLVSDELAATLS